MNERAKRIKALIDESKKTYQELENITGIKKSSLQRYASGATAKIPLTAVERLATAFGVPASYIMWGEEQEKPAEITFDGLSPVKKEILEKVMQMSDEKLQKLNLLLQIVEAK